jgi:hypothetical protein
VGNSTPREWKVNQPEFSSIYLFFCYRDADPDRKVVGHLIREVPHIPFYRAVLDNEPTGDVRKKMYPRILDSIGVVGLWTSRAEESRWIVSELRYARKNQKDPLLFRDGPQSGRPRGWPLLAIYHDLLEFNSPAGWGNENVSIYSDDVRSLTLKGPIDTLVKYYRQRLKAGIVDARANDPGVSTHEKLLRLRLSEFEEEEARRLERIAKDDWSQRIRG